MTDAGIKKLREIVAEMREFGHQAAVVDNERVSPECLLLFADRIEEALSREAELADDDQWAPRHGKPTSPAPTAKFDEAAFDAAVSKPSGWDAVPDHVAEIRRMRDGTPSSPEAVLEVLRAFHDAHYSVFPRDELTERLCNAYYDQFVADAPAGNAAAMREALEMFVTHASCLYHCDVHRFHPTETSCDGKFADGTDCPMKPECDAVFKGRAALSAPARNCDILSEEAANEAWGEYRHSHVLPRGGWDFRHIIAWLFAKEETRP